MSFFWTNRFSQACRCSSVLVETYTDQIDNAINGGNVIEDLSEWLLDSDITTKASNTCADHEHIKYNLHNN